MSDKVRLKDLDANSKAKYETLSPDLKAFTQEYEELTGKVFKITSAKREAKDKIGKGHKHSHHNTGDALDFSAMNYEDYNFLVNTKEGLALMDKYKLGVLDETDPTTLEKTGGTGAHFHLGKDSKLHLNTRQRLEAFDSGVEPVFSYKQRYEMGENPKVITPDVKEEFSVPFEEKQYQDIFTRVAEKEMVKTVKEEQSKDRQEVKKEISREEEFLKNYLTESTKKQTVNNQTSQEQPLEEININVDLQTQLPELPNIFQIPEMKEGGTVVSGNTTVVTDKEGNKTTKVIGKDGKTYIKVETKDGKVYNKVIQPMRSTMSYKESEDYKNGIQYPVIINQSDNTNVTKPYIKNTQSKELIADIEGQKALANQLVTSGAASRYLGDKYWNQKGDESLRDMILKEIQRNPNLMKAIEKQEYKYLIDREQKAYDKASPFEKTASFIHSAVSDPVLVGSNLLEGKAPMLWQGVNLRDDRNPEVQRFYNQATGANNNIVNTVFNTINPGNIGANASQNVKEGDYLGVAMDVAELIGLGAGAINPVNYAGAINKAKDAVKNTLKYITKNTEEILPSVGFKSEIDWENWVVYKEDFHNNPDVIQHLYDIEQKSKANGTWMKNSDGTPFEGTKEQYVVRQSDNFKKAYHNGYEETWRGIKQGNSPSLKPNRAMFTGDEVVSEYYVQYGQENAILNSEEAVRKGGMLNLIHPKSNNSLVHDTRGSDWQSVNLDSEEESLKSVDSSISMLQDLIPRQKEMLKKATFNSSENYWQLPNSDIKISNDEYLEGTKLLEESLKQLLETKAKGFISTNQKLLTDMKLKLGSRPNTDNIAEYVEKNNVDYVTLKNIQDGAYGDVSIINHKPGNYLKSASNNILYDMSNPNIFKSLIPITVGSGLLYNQRNNNKLNIKT